MKDKIIEQKALIESKAGLLVTCKFPFADVVRELTDLINDITVLEQESKEEPKDMYDYPLTTANNHVQLSESRGTELPPVDLEQVLGSKQEGAEEILAKCTCIDLKELEFKNEVQIIRPSESLEAMQEYAQQSRREELIKYEIAQNTVGGKLHGSKERIIECVDKYLNPKP
ncbi:MAG: hypothetical protein ABIJ40_19780 [Bacteroidota bacterium]